MAAACVGSVPMFYPSPSGQFCAVHWPQSLMYVVLRLANSSPTAGSTVLTDVDKGFAISLGWIGGAEGITEDVLALILPEKKTGSERKKGFLGKLNVLKKEDKLNIEHQKLVLKSVSSGGCFDVDSISMPSSACSNIFGTWVPVSLRGGPLLCITLSKEDVKTITTSGPPDMLFKSQFYRLIPYVSLNETRRVPKTEIGLDDQKLMPVKPRYRLEVVESAVREVSSVAWMYRKDASYCGIAVDGRVTLLSYSQSTAATNGGMQVLRAVEVSRTLPSPTLYVSWTLNPTAAGLLVEGLSEPESVNLESEEKISRASNFLWVHRQEVSV
jgi:hypothetical protein